MRQIKNISGKRFTAKGLRQKLNNSAMHMAVFKNRFFIGLILIFASGMLSACGDDLGIPVWAEQPETQTADSGKDPVNAGRDILQGEELLAESEETAESGGTEESFEAKGDPEQEDSSESSVVSITISAAGDVTLGNHQNQGYGYSFRQTYDQAYDDGYFFENVLDIFEQDDMTLVNLEGVLTRSEAMREGQTYNIKGDPEYVNLLTCGNIEAVSMGNNHRLDYGEEGSTDTVEALEQAQIAYAFDENLGIYEVKGIRIGFVSVNEVYWGAGVEKTLQEGLEKLKEETDLVIVCCHWGIERENYPEDYQRTLGKKCIDWGADLVIGHHPHVLQGIEEYQGKYIVYSLGNFCFGANRNPQDKDTMIFQQTFTFVDGVKEEDREIRVIPCFVSSVPSRNDFKPTPAQGEEAARILGRINEYSKDFGVSFGEDGVLAQ